MHYIMSLIALLDSQVPSASIDEGCLGTGVAYSVYKFLVDPSPSTSSSLRMRRLMFFIYLWWVSTKMGFCAQQVSCVVETML
jgi:hypothetical protein